MPEGDAIKRIANQLAPLVGQTIERATTQGLVRELAGRAVTAVTTHGKHLVIELDDAHQIRVHLGMNGRFRRAVTLHCILLLAETDRAVACRVVGSARLGMTFNYSKPGLQGARGARSSVGIGVALQADISKELSSWLPHSHFNPRPHLPARFRRP